MKEIVCKKCNSKHRLYLENRITGERIPVDYCKECLIGKVECKKIHEQVKLTDHEKPQEENLF